VTVLRAARRTDLARLAAALARLSDDLGDRHLAGEAELDRAAFGPAPAVRAVLAEVRPEAPLAGVALFSPTFSTVEGAAGAYVSDLWVAPEGRGAKLGRRLLGAVAEEAGRLWGARHLRLTVYDDNPRAVAFYARLGFVERGRDRAMVLNAKGLAALAEPA